MAESEFLEWMRFAKDDLEAARILLDHRPRKVEIICYHCEQAAEKYLKAVLARKDADIPRTHSLLSIAKNVGLNNTTLAAIVKSLATLQPYAVEVRYPFQLVGGEGMEELAMKAAEHVASIVEGLFNA